MVFFISNLTNADYTWNDVDGCYDITGGITVKRLNLKPWPTANVRHQACAMKIALNVETGGKYAVLAFDEKGECVAYKDSLWAIEDSDAYKQFMAECKH